MSEMPADRVPVVAAWDLPTRLFKWGVVLLVIGAWASHEFGDVTLRWHKLNGYAILILVLFRILWGLFGSSTARFAQWVKGPGAVVRHAFDMARGRRESWLGHTPLGGWMVLALLVVLGVQGVAGLFSVDSNGVFGGPFAHTDFMEPSPEWKSRLSWLHHHAFDWMLWLIGAHILVGLIHQFVFKDGLITSMVTGKKRVASFRDDPAMIPAKALWGRALACLAIAIAVVLGGVKLAGGSLI
jgi:cytochrome b